MVGFDREGFLEQCSRLPTVMGLKEEPAPLDLEIGVRLGSID